VSYADDDEMSDLAYQALTAHDRERRRASLRVLSVLFFVLVPALGVIVWLTTVGYQHHVLEIESGGRTFRIVSHKSPFEVYTPNDDFAKPVEGGLFGCVRDDFRTDHVETRNYEWASYVSTCQRVHLPDGLIDYQFFVNNIPFSLTRSELKSGDSRWQASQDETRDINVDKLSPPPPQPVSRPSISNE
jgi:hypothetical protein